MYKIYADDVLIYDDTSSDTHLKVVSPQLSLEDNCAGSLKIVIPPGNAGYDTIQRMITEIKVTKDDNEIWSGRVLQESKDFWNQRSLVCEGELAYFNDTVQEPHSYTRVGLRSYLNDIIDNHNDALRGGSGFDKTFILGVVDPAGVSFSLDVNYDKTLECLNKVIEDRGGHFILRKVYDEGQLKRQLNYYQDWPDTSAQKIEFGRNLMDVTKSSDSTEFATVLLPLGKKKEQQDPGGLDAYQTVDRATYTDKDGNTQTHYGDYVNYCPTLEPQSLEPVYGRIVKVVHWDDVDNKNELLQNAFEYLKGIWTDTIELELSALDLHYWSKEIPTIRLGDRVYVTSKPHGIDSGSTDPFPVTKLDIPLDQPQNTKFRLGAKVTTSLTAVNNKINEEIKKAIDNAVDEDAILNQAKANTNAIMNQTLNGYVTIFTENDPDTGVHSEGLYISDTSPLTKTDPPNPNRPYSAQRMWKWTVAGLGYSDDYGATWKAAITMDGSILGERIAAGSIHGSKITAGSLGLVTTAGQEACSIGLKVSDLTANDLEIGGIESDGSNVDASNKARTVRKKYFSYDDKVKVSIYNYEVYRYDSSVDRDDPELGFVRQVLPFDPEEPSRRYFKAGEECTIPANDCYRFVVLKDTSVTESDLGVMGAAFDFGDAVVIAAADIRINGMVTFSSLSNPQSTTFIDGGNIHTGTINLKGITVRDDRDEPTLEINEHGVVTLSSSSYIHFGLDDDRSLGSIANEDIAKAIANGIYSGGAFIENDCIYGPKIYADLFTALPRTTPDASDKSTGGFLLKGYYGNVSNPDSDLIDVFKISFYGGDTPTTIFDAYGSLRLPRTIEIPGDSGGYGGYIRSISSLVVNPILDNYTTLQGGFKVNGVLYTSGGNSQTGGKLVVNNGTGQPGDYFVGTVPLGTVYFMWEY